MTAIEVMDLPESDEAHMHRVHINGNRPDFRVFIDLLYGAGHNVDTDGDSYPVNSRTWTWLCIADRQRGAARVEIGASERDSSMFELRSSSRALEELASIYLFLYCGTSLALGEEVLGPEEIEALKKQYESQLQRAANAVWHGSSDDKPYPNLT